MSDDVMGDNPGRREVEPDEPEAAGALVESADQMQVQIDLFDLMGHGGQRLPIKSDTRSMMWPFFSLKTKPDLERREYESGGRFIRVIPSTSGAPTIFDKDLIIYAMSHMADAQNRHSPASRRIRMRVTDFFRATKRSTGGAAYERVVDMCRRMKGTVFETNIKTTDEERTEGFSMIEGYSIIASTANGKGALQLEIVLSSWFWRAVVEMGILTMSPAYFELRQALERRVYEVARAHFFKAQWWVVNLDVLKAKVGSQQTPRKWRQEVRAMAAADRLPEYHVFVEDTKPARAVFISRDVDKVLEAAREEGKEAWVAKFLQPKLV